MRGEPKEKKKNRMRATNGSINIKANGMATETGQCKASNA